MSITSQMHLEISDFSGIGLTILILICEFQSLHWLSWMCKNWLGEQLVKWLLINWAKHPLAGRGGGAKSRVLLSKQSFHNYILISPSPSTRRPSKVKPVHCLMKTSFLPNNSAKLPWHNNFQLLLCHGHMSGLWVMVENVWNHTLLSNIIAAKTTSFNFCPSLAAGVIPSHVWTISSDNIFWERCTATAMMEGSLSPHLSRTWAHKTPASQWWALDADLSQ